jgi:hypothetical protein
MGVAGIYDHPAHRQRMNPPLLEALDESIGGSLPQEFLLPAGGTVQNGPVLGHNPFEQTDLGEYGDEIIQLPPGHQNELPAVIKPPRPVRTRHTRPFWAMVSS